MHQFRKKRIYYSKNSQKQSNEEKSDNDTNNNQIDSNTPSYKRNRFKNYRRQNKNEETEKNENMNNAKLSNKETSNIELRKIKEGEKKETNKVIIEPSGLNNDDSSTKENSNPNINFSSKKKEILEKLKDVVPILEDMEGEDNVTPDKENESIYPYSDSKTLNKNVRTTEFKIDNISFNDNFTNKKLRNSMTVLTNNKKKYDNELIDAIINVEKDNVGKYLSEELASIYNEINRDNIIFKNEVFLDGVDIFEKKTCNLDRKKYNTLYDEKKVKKKIFTDPPNADEVINEFFEKSKMFH